MKTIGKLTALGTLCGLVALPVMASADPPAVGAPSIPAVFVGAPTNDNPNAGQFTVNFASNGDYEGTGIAEPPASPRDLTVNPGRPQGRVSATTPSATERASVDRIFARLRDELRGNAAPEAALRVSR